MANQSAEHSRRLQADVVARGPGSHDRPRAATPRGSAGRRTQAATAGDAEATPVTGDPYGGGPEAYLVQEEEENPWVDVYVVVDDGDVPPRPAPPPQSRGRMNRPRHPLSHARRRVDSPSNSDRSWQNVDGGASVPGSTAPSAQGRGRPPSREEIREAMGRLRAEDPWALNAAVIVQQQRLQRRGAGSAAAMEMPAH